MTPLSQAEISLARNAIVQAADANDGAIFKTNDLRKLLAGSEPMQLLAADVRAEAVTAIIATLLDRGAILPDGIRPGARDAYCRVVDLNVIGGANAAGYVKPAQTRRDELA